MNEGRAAVQSNAKAYAPLIDVVRCGAALLVACFHLWNQWPHLMIPPAFKNYPDVSAFNGAFYYGWVAVEVFFVISGFVIAESCHGRTAKSFFVARALRILPLLWLISLIGLLIQVTAGAPMGATLIATAKNMVIWPNGGWLDSVVWSLAPECGFYALVWLSLVISSDTDRSLRNIAIGLILLSGAFNVFNLTTNILGPFVLKALLLKHGAFFSLGIAIWARAAGRRGFGLIQLAAVPVCVLEIYLQNRFYASEGGSSGGMWFVTPILIWVLALAVIMVGSVRTTPLPIGWIRTAGLITFPIYLAHRNVGAPIVIALTSAGIPVALSVVVALLVVVLVSWSLVMFVEPHVKPVFRHSLQAVANRLDFRSRTPRAAPVIE